LAQLPRHHQTRVIMVIRPPPLLLLGQQLLEWSALLGAVVV
jgi:hypothetical protein